jgi:hypothetical protein
MVAAVDARFGTFAGRDISTQLPGHATNAASAPHSNMVESLGSTCIPPNTSREQAFAILNSTTDLPK